MEEKRAQFLGIPGIGWGFIGGGLLILAIAWAFFRSSGSGSIF